MIVLINPNSTVSMTEAMLTTARQCLPGHQVEGWTSHGGPSAIQGAADGEAATPPLLDLVAEAGAKGARCIIIGCFDDTALAEARALAPCPVIGIGQGAYHMAALAGPRFSVVTTVAVAVPILEANIEAYGLRGYLGQVRASGIPVLALEEEPDAAMRKVEATISDIIAEDGPQTIVLGCGGMVEVQARLAATSGLRLIDGVRAAAHIAGGLV